MLMLECFGRGEPALEIVRVVAGKVVDDHVSTAGYRGGSVPTRESRCSRAAAQGRGTVDNWTGFRVGKVRRDALQSWAPDATCVVRLIRVSLAPHPSDGSHRCPGLQTTLLAA